jgi:hypothetical protein
MAAVRLVPVETSCWIFAVADRVDRVAGGATHRVEGFDQRDAGGEHGGQRAGPARDAGLFDQRAEDGQLEHHAVHDLLDALVALPGLHEEVDSAADAAEDQPPVLDEELAHADHEQRGRGQVGAEGREHLLEGRDHEDHDDCHHHEGHDDHRRSGTSAPT